MGGNTTLVARAILCLLRELQRGHDTVGIRRRTPARRARRIPSGRARRWPSPVDAPAVRLDDRAADRESHAVTKLSNICSRSIFAPPPVSATATSTWPRTGWLEVTVIRRSISPPRTMASLAFMTRFKKTCWSWMGSPDTGGRPSFGSPNTGSIPQRDLVVMLVCLNFPRSAGPQHGGPCGHRWAWVILTSSISPGRQRSPVPQARYAPDGER